MLVKSHVEPATYRDSCGFLAARGLAQMFVIELTTARCHENAMPRPSDRSWLLEPLSGAGAGARPYDDAVTEPAHIALTLDQVDAMSDDELEDLLDPLNDGLARNGVTSAP